MKRVKQFLSILLVCSMLTFLVACESEATVNNTTQSSEEESQETNTEKSTVNLASLSSYQQDNESLAFDESAWNYDEEKDVYWQLGVPYSSNPETTDYETVAIYVPGKYMTASANGDGTYTCVINEAGTINGYTAATAPIVFPVNTAGYSAQKAATSYSYDGLSSYLDAGFIYVYAGMRGRNNGYDDSGNLTYSGGAPWGVTDLKAAIRYYRFNQNVLPGDTDHIFTFGHSGGGAQSTLMGTTGDSEFYYKYLTSIGAAMFDSNGEYISDSIYGVMAWCPITSLDYADEAYEWNMGQYSTSGTRADGTWTSALSKDMAEAFGSYINELGLTDEDGVILSLEQTEDGVYTSGSYYDYILSVAENSLNNFLSDSSFPYTKSAGGMMGDGGFGGGGSGEGMPEMAEGEMPGGEMPEGGPPEGQQVSGDSSEEATSTTYATAQDYIDVLNADEEWVKYDSATNTVKITSLEAFSKHVKSATKDVAAFDDLNLKQAENYVFGDENNDALHFDATLTSLLKENQSKYAEFSDFDASYLTAYEAGLQSINKFNDTSEVRQNMYNPMYYLSSYYEGYNTSTVAPHWRIHSGIEQGDTSLTVETNLALALSRYKGVQDVEFESVWGKGHTTAERVGDSTDNFISWVNESVKN